jgi:Mn2+/Fe2+ NRAMP family transporter
VLVLGSFARIALIFKVLCAALLSYLVVAVLVTHQWGSLLNHTLIPRIELNKAYLALLVAVLGTTISPYLFFWQSAHRLEEMRDEPEGGAKAQPLNQQDPKRARRKQSTSRLDFFTGMTFSNLVTFAIIVATAQTLHNHGKPRACSTARRAAEGLALRGMATVRTPRASRSRSVAGSPYPRSAVTEWGVRPARRAIQLIAGASWGASGGLPVWTP